VDRRGKQRSGSGLGKDSELGFIHHSIIPLPHCYLVFIPTLLHPFWANQAHIGPCRSFTLGPVIGVGLLGSGSANISLLLRTGMLPCRSVWKTALQSLQVLPGSQRRQHTRPLDKCLFNRLVATTQSALQDSFRNLELD
jgi:hypothetical protein